MEMVHLVELVYCSGYTKYPFVFNFECDSNGSKIADSEIQTGFNQPGIDTASN